MADLVLTGFPPSLLARIDRYIRILEELNPGHTWTRTTCIATLVARSLAEVEGYELRRKRRQGKDRRSVSRGSERRQGAEERRDGGDRRSPHYPEMVDLVIEHLLREKHGLAEGDTWRDRHESD
jgi:hypothetical protein